jgi:hypothetical protein
MNRSQLKLKLLKLTTSSNPEWAFILNLRAIVGHEFYAHGWMTKSTFDAVVDWKLRKQRGRTEKHREGITPELLREITGAFWRVHHVDPEKEMEIKLALLMAIPGVGMGVATAILTLTFPESYGVIDFRNWKVLFGEDKKQFIVGDYVKYLDRLRELAEELDCDVQEIDYVLWKEYESKSEDDK